MALSSPRRRNALIALLLIFGMMGALAAGGIWLLASSLPTPEPTAVALATEPPPTATPTPTATATRPGIVVVTRPPTATPDPTATPTVTDTPFPTLTPTPRDTATPTLTPTATPTPTGTSTATPIPIAVLAQALPLATPVVQDNRSAEQAARAAATAAILADYRRVSAALAAQMALVDADPLRLGYGDWVAQTGAILAELRGLSARAYALGSDPTQADLLAIVAAFDLAADTLQLGLGTLDATTLGDFRRYFDAARASLAARAPG